MFWIHMGGWIELSVLSVTGKLVISCCAIRDSRQWGPKSPYVDRKGGVGSRILGKPIVNLSRGDYKLVSEHSLLRALKA